MEGDILKPDDGVVLELQHNFAGASRAPADLCVIKTPTTMFVQCQVQFGSHARLCVGAALPERLALHIWMVSSQQLD